MKQCAAVVPSALPPGKGSDAHPGERVGQPEPVQDPGRVRADLDAGADLGELTGLLVDVNVEASLEQGERGGEAPDAAAGDADRETLAHLTCGRTSRLKRAS
jgi:hypothetical protein